MDILKPYIMTFIPFFVAVNILGILPIFISLTEGTQKRHLHKIVINSVLTATIIAIFFMFIGKLIFWVMGITVADFKIAGGILLLILSVHLLLPGDQKRAHATTDVGIFPLGTPLITGPAVLTTSLVMIDAYGLIPTLVSFLLNMIIVWVVLYKSNVIIAIMGIGGSTALSKVADIVLTAIAVMMIRSGIIEILGTLAL